MALMSCSVFAQGIDAFFAEDDSYDNRIVDNSFILHLPTGTIGSMNNEYAPLGSGLIIMTVLGASYSIRKRQKRLQTMQNLTSKQDLKVSHS